MAWLPYAIGAGGALLGPTGAAWAILNYRTDRDGKKISQTGEIIAMFQAYIDEMEKALVRAEEALEKELLAHTGTSVELQACRAECERLRRELASVRHALDRHEQGGLVDE